MRAHFELYIGEKMYEKGLNIDFTPYVGMTIVLARFAEIAWSTKVSYAGYEMDPEDGHGFWFIRLRSVLEDRDLETHITLLECDWSVFEK